MNNERHSELRRIANRVRRHILDGVYSAGCGHPGGSLSIADVLTYLYFEEMRVDPMNPQDPKRDRFVLSKGHTAPALAEATKESITNFSIPLIPSAKATILCLVPPKHSLPPPLAT